MLNLLKISRQFVKLCQQQPEQNIVEQPQPFSPKFTSQIQINQGSITRAIADLSAARSLIKDSFTITAINKCINYLNWYKTIGAGGNVSMQGKDELVPSVNDIKAMVNSKLFGKDFIISLVAIFNLNDYVADINNEFTKIQS